MDAKIDTDQVRAACELYNKMSQELEQAGWQRRPDCGVGRLNLGDWWYWVRPDRNGPVPMDRAIEELFSKPAPPTTW